MATPANKVKPFDPDGSRYDMTTYWGRVNHFFDMVDLRNVLLSDSEVAASVAMVDDYRAGKWRDGDHDRPSDEALWAAKKRMDAVLHPETREKIPLAFRMSAFMPANLPISAGMLLSPPGAWQLMFQWLNQSYNAGFNYANRNASVPLDTTALATSYAVATGTALGAAWGLGRVVQRMQARVGDKPTFSLKLLSRALPWMAVATAGAANAVAMRYKEGIDGITVYDQDGQARGTSVAAGRAGLLQVALTRVVLPVPILLMPPFILDAARSSKALGPAMARSLGVRTAVELGIIAVFLQMALPFAVALFPQTATVPASTLEPSFQGLTTASGAPVKDFTFNKGL